MPKVLKAVWARRWTVGLLLDAERGSLGLTRNVHLPLSLTATLLLLLLLSVLLFQLLLLHPVLSLSLCFSLTLYQAIALRRRHGGRSMRMGVSRISAIS